MEAMDMRDVDGSVTVPTNYAIGEQRLPHGPFAGGVDYPEHMGEFHFNLSEDIDSDEDTGKLQINIRGTRRSYFEFAQYLLSLIAYSQDTELKDPDYHDHIEVLADDGQPVVHLIVHAPT
jgi:hypothetical protein